MNSPPTPKRIRLDEEMTLEKLPDNMLDKILRFLPMKDRIHNSLVSKRWQKAMPYTNQSGWLCVTDLPFKADLLVATARGYDYVTHSGITAALECLLPQIGSELKKLSFSSADRYWEMVASHLDLIVQHCPGLTELNLMEMWNAEGSDFNCEALRRLTQVTNLELGRFLDATAVEDNFRLILDMTSLIAALPLMQLDLTNFDVLPFVFAPNLTNLSLFSCKGFGDFQLAQICQSSTKLTDLIIDACVGLKDFSPVAQLQHLTSLELVDVPLRNGDMELIARTCADLNSLKLKEVEVDKFTWLRHIGQLKLFSFGPDLNDSDMADIPANWSTAGLELSESQLTDAGLEQLSCKSPQLERLTLDSENVTDEGINRIAASWDQLEYLKISNAKITGVSVANLGERKNLRQLHFHRCSQIKSVDGNWLRVAKRLQLGISTPLRIQLGRNHAIFTGEMIDQLREQLKKVGVELTH